MKLDRHIIELLSLLEKATETPSYTFIPQIIREEISEIHWKPVYSKNSEGHLTTINHKLKVIYHDKKSA